ITCEEALAPFIIALHRLMPAPVGSPSPAGGVQQGLVFTLETDGQLLGRKVIEHASDRRAAGGKQGYLVGLQVTKGAIHSLVGQHVSWLVVPQQSGHGLLAAGTVLDRVVSRALDGCQREPQVILQLVAGMQILLQVSVALSQELGGFQRQCRALLPLDSTDIDAKRLAELFPETVRQMFGWRGRNSLLVPWRH